MESEILLLAAGKSTRAGQPKGLIPHRGKPWLLHQAETLSFARLLVVVGFHRESYEKVLDGTRAEIVVNPHPEEGQFASLQVGLRHSSAKSVFVLPLDTPAPERELWEELEAALIPPARVVVPEFGGRGGHPVLLARDFLQELVQLPTTDRLDAAIHRLTTASVRRVRSSDARLVMNLNSPADFAEHSA